jgi:hypothetical protein
MTNSCKCLLRRVPELLPRARAANPPARALIQIASHDRSARNSRCARMRKMRRARSMAALESSGTQRHDQTGTGMIESRKVEFPGATGAMLAARRDLPAQPRAFALFAHCFSPVWTSSRRRGSPKASRPAASPFCALTLPASAAVRVTSPIQTSHPTSATFWPRRPGCVSIMVLRLS